MKTVVIIPARYGSTRFQGKPLAKIAQKPMIAHVCERCRRADCVSEAVVATDDSRIFDVVTRLGCRAVMTGEKNRSGTDRVAEAADQMGLQPDDIIINVQGDQPLIDPRCLDAVAAPLLKDPGESMSTLAFKIVNPEEITNPKDVKVVFDHQARALYFSRSPIPCARDAFEVFDTFKHLGVYAYTRRFLDIFRNLPEGNLERIEKLEQLRALEYGYTIRVVVTPYDSPEVDIPADIARIEQKLKAL